MGLNVFENLGQQLMFRLISHRDREFAARRHVAKATPQLLSNLPMGSDDGENVEYLIITTAGR
jgi:hypothetical protein